MGKLMLLLHRLTYTVAALLTLALAVAIVATPYVLPLALDLHPLGLLAIGLAAVAFVAPIYGAQRFLAGSHRVGWFSIGAVWALGVAVSVFLGK